MPDEDDKIYVYTLIDELKKKLSDGSLSLEEFKDKLQSIPSDVIIDEQLLLHAVCLNLNECSISLEIIECIYNFYPRAVEFSTDANSNHDYTSPIDCTEAYPLHLACYNENIMRTALIQ